MTTPRTASHKRSLRVIAVLLGSACLACTGEESAPRIEAAPSPRVPALLSAHGDDELHVQARWEKVAAFKGTGSTTTRSFSIAPHAIQWRVRWECDGNSTLAVRPSGLGDEDDRLVDAKCPGSGEATAIDTGTQSLDVDAHGAWRVIVDQQVDTPLYERPLPEMTAPDARIIGRGELYDVELEGTGEAIVYGLGDGRLAIRLRDFWLTPNIDLELWTSTLGRPKTSKELVRTEHAKIAFLRATAGSQNYLLPRDLGPSDVRSIAIWCELTHQIYAAAQV